MINENPADHIEAMASQEDISINELCETAKVARTTLTRWKNGTTSPNWATINKFEAAIKNIVASRKIKPKRSN